MDHATAPTTFTLPLQALALWMGEAEPQAAVQDAAIAFGTPDVAFVDPMARRRLSPLARAAIACAHRVAPPHDARMVFASRHGDLEKTLGLMREVAQDMDLSPMAFSHSVHNAVTGLWSILRKDASPASAVAAGADTFAMGLLEAWAAWRRTPDHPVIYVFAEAQVPQVYRPLCPSDAVAHALAFRLGEPCSKTLRMDWDPDTRQAEPALPQSLHALRVLTGMAPPSTWTGPQGTWAWHVA